MLPNSHNNWIFPVPWMNNYTVYPKKYAHGFVVLCFVVVIQSFIMNSHEVFIHIHQGCFAGTGAIVRLPQCQWSKPDGYGKISQCITTTKHSKAKPVCIFLGIYCTNAPEVIVRWKYVNRNDIDGLVKTAVTPLLTLWSYCSLALSYRYVVEYSGALQAILGKYNYMTIGAKPEKTHIYCFDCKFILASLQTSHHGCDPYCWIYPRDRR